MTQTRGSSRFSARPPALTAASPSVRQLRAEVMTHIQDQHQKDLDRLRASVRRLSGEIKALRGSVADLIAARLHSNP